MGNTLPHPVTCKVVNRGGNKHFKAATCSMNGFREHMEDAHCMIAKDDYGYFGVFDGHSGSKCSEFCASRFPEEIAKASKPIPDKALEEITLAIDAEFISRTKESGSTATMFVATKAKTAGHFDIQVGNVGDSRVLIVQQRACVPMTTDHKPSLATERKRIERCGGAVVVDRVDGMLAMSRAMGDPEYKRRGGSQLEQKVIAQPDITHAVCGPSDYILVCCDGLFEHMTNDEVVLCVNAQLQQGADLGDAMCALCEESLSKGSTDNMTAMIVQFCDGSSYGPTCQFVPGPTNPHRAFTLAYKTMAETAGLTYGQALEMRYDQLRQNLLDANKTHHTTTEDDDDKKGKNKKKGGFLGVTKKPKPKPKPKAATTLFNKPIAEHDAMRQWKEELTRFQVGGEKGPAANLGAENRTAWFDKLSQHILSE